MVQKNKSHCGGVCGAVIGVSNMGNALQFYADVLGINKEVYNVIDDANNYPAARGKKFHRVLICKARPWPSVSRRRWSIET